MFLDYRLSINIIPKNAALIDIQYDNDIIKSAIHSSVSVEKYALFSFSKNTIYKNIADATNAIDAYKVIWKNVNHLIINIAPSLLLEDNKLEHIISNLSSSFLGNVYSSKNKITLTHNGKKLNENLKKIITLIEKIQTARIISMISANIATPENTATKLEKLFKHIPNIEIKIIKHKYLYKNGYNLIRAVGEGSKNPPCMLVIERKGSSSNKTVCIIGKGITFDSGGLSIKTIDNMKTMKFDKIGAVYGSISLLHLLEDVKLKNVNFVGIFPFAENVISEKSMLPGDVVTSFIGKTVEISDPDAEGRLILADAFGHARAYKPDLIIDIATLTGHASYINCYHSGYYYASPDNLKYQIEKITDEIGERMIAMPTWRDYSDILKSDVADLINEPEKCGDSFFAAMFLREFLPHNSDWIHIDLSHELHKNIPNGNGIRSIIKMVKYYICKEKKN
jgi:leucyl aminopeptidase